MHWYETDKGDPRCRRLADKHYTRQRPGHPMWTRPGWTQVLYCPAGDGSVFCWWRPKWEDGRPGLERKDGLRAIECTMFRNCSGILSSALIREAVAAVLTWEHARDVEWADGLISGVGSEQTRRRRSKRHEPGHCFRMAGWAPFEHPGGRADVWLRYAGPLATAARAPLLERRGQTSFVLGNSL